MAAPRPIELNGRPVADGAFPLIITPLVGRAPADIMAELAAILPKRPDLLEWRVDCFEAIADTALVIETARRIKHAAGQVPLLLTRRNVTEGGQAIALDEPAVVALYRQACAARCVDLIDYELSNPPQFLEELRAVSAAHGIAMVMSCHDFRRTPGMDALLDRFETAQRLGADIAKVAVMPADAQDVLTLLAATWRASQSLRIPLISMSMGAVGAASRVTGWLYGSAATFAVGQSSSAPGQIAIEDLRATLTALRRALAAAG